MVVGSNPPRDIQLFFYGFSGIVGSNPPIDTDDDPHISDDNPRICYPLGMGRVCVGGFVNPPGKYDDRGLKYEDLVLQIVLVSHNICRNCQN